MKKTILTCDCCGKEFVSEYYTPPIEITPGCYTQIWIFYVEKDYMINRFYTIEEIISREQKKIAEINEKLNSEFISDPYCPGGFRKPDKYDKQLWKETLKYSQSIVRYLSRIK